MWRPFGDQINNNPNVSFSNPFLLESIFFFYHFYPSSCGLSFDAPLYIVALIDSIIYSNFFHFYFFIVFNWMGWWFKSTIETFYTKLYWLSTARPDSVSIAFPCCWVGVLIFVELFDCGDWIDCCCCGCGNSKSQVLIRMLPFNVIIWWGCLIFRRKEKRSKNFKN